jgi:hypothetical protein
LIEVLPWVSLIEAKGTLPNRILIRLRIPKRLGVIPLPNRLLALVLDQPGRAQVIRIDVIGDRPPFPR